MFVFNVQTEPFQKPVSLEQHPDYAEYIFHPMDLSTIEKVLNFLSTENRGQRDRMLNKDEMKRTHRERI